MVSRDISLGDKRVCTPKYNYFYSFFLVPIVVAAPTTTTPIDGPSYTNVTVLGTATILLDL
jgi:hypothetical protein